MSTAQVIVSEAFERQNLAAVTNFATSQEFPYSIALRLLNRTIKQMNRMGNFIFTETETALTYGVSTYTYDCSDNNIDPKRIKYIRKEATNSWGNLKQYNWQDFKKAFRLAALQTAEPTAWTKFNDTIELNTQPDANYNIRVTHYRDMPVITALTDSQATGAILVPVNDEDILIDGVESFLCEAIGTLDWVGKRTLWEQSLKRFLADDERDVGIPLQLPRMF